MIFTYIICIACHIQKLYNEIESQIIGKHTIKDYIKFPENQLIVHIYMKEEILKDSKCMIVKDNNYKADCSHIKNSRRLIVSIKKDESYLKYDIEQLAINIVCYIQIKYKQLDNVFVVLSFDESLKSHKDGDYIYKNLIKEIKHYNPTFTVYDDKSFAYHIQITEEVIKKGTFLDTKYIEYNFYFLKNKEIYLFNLKVSGIMEYIKDTLFLEYSTIKNKEIFEKLVNMIPIRLFYCKKLIGSYKDYYQIANITDNTAESRLQIYMEGNQISSFYYKLKREEFRNLMYHISHMERMPMLNVSTMIVLFSTVPIEIVDEVIKNIFKDPNNYKFTLCLHYLRNYHKNLLSKFFDKRTIIYKNKWNETELNQYALILKERIVELQESFDVIYICEVHIIKILFDEIEHIFDKCTHIKWCRVISELMKALQIKNDKGCFNKLYRKLFSKSILGFNSGAKEIISRIYNFYNKRRYRNKSYIDDLNIKYDKKILKIFN